MKVDRHLATLAVVAPLVLLAACGTEKAQAREEVPPLVLAPEDVADAHLADLDLGVTVSGPLEPADVVVVKSQIAGTIRNLRVDRGVAVSRGQLLAEIEAEGVRSQAAGARASVQAAQANLAVAKQRLDAAKRLHDAGAIAEIDVKTAQANFDAADAQLALAKAQAAGAEEASGRTFIRAPITGIVSTRDVEDGEAVNTNVQLLTVVNTSALELEGRIGVGQAAHARPGQKVIFTLDDLPGEELTGSVNRIDPVADVDTRQVAIHVRLPNPKGRIVAGQFARGRILSEGRVHALVIPESALLGTADSAVVLTLAGNRIARRSVVPGARDETTGMVVITRGLTAGEKVLVHPRADLGDGTTVTVASDRPASAPTPAAGRSGGK